MLVSMSDMPELLKAEIPLKTPSHQGWTPFVYAAAGRLLAIQAPRPIQPNSCHITR